MKLHVLPLGAALALYAATPLTAQTLSSWTDPVNVAASAGTLTKSGGCDGCPDSGAFSTMQLTGDGYAEFIPAAGSRLYGGLGNDLTASTSSLMINYSFSIWPTGAYEIRELGVYRADGTFAAGDRFRVAVENGVVVYRKNGTLVYTSAVAPTYPLVFDTSLYSLGASLSQASVVAGTGSTTSTGGSASTGGSGTGGTGGTASPSGTTSGSPTRTTVGPYLGVTDRNAYAKPAVPALGPAGSTIVDPVFQSMIVRATDGTTRPDHQNVSYRSPSSPHQNAWSANGSYFYVVSDDGTAIPFAFNGTTGTASRVTPSTTGPGGLTLSFYIEPQFSYLNDAVIYGSVSNGNLHTIDQYDFSTGVYTRILDLETLVSGLSGTYIGGVASSAGATERIMAMFGGTSQDHHHLVIVFDRANPANHQLVDTWASTLNGAPTSSVLNFSLHHVAIDRSGRYLMLYPTSADQTGVRKAPQSVAWDTQTGTFTEMPLATHPYGHDSFGYGVSVNQDCCVNTTYDGVQWQFRNLSTPAASRDVLSQVLTPQEVYISDHSTWNNARSDQLVPYVSGLFRYGTSNTTPWRALDDEIVAVETDVPGQNPTIWRFAHHRSNVADDTNPANTSFWYEPRPNVSNDGRWAMFTSNWEKTLGTDPAGDTGSGFRQDVFIVQLAAASSASTPPAAPPPPSVVPVAISTTTLPSGRVTVAYSATPQATGGAGGFTWTVSGGTLPTGLTLNASTGAVTGTPTAAGSSTITLTAADSTDPSNKASANYTIVIGSAPVVFASSALPVGRATVAYSTTLQATGGSGTFAWVISTGALPAGVSLNASTGSLAGTPTAAGHSSFVVTVADAADQTNTATASFAIDINPAPVAITTAALAGGRVTVSYAAALQASGGAGTYVWSLASGALPAGLSLSVSTGAISGIPQSAGTTSVVIAVADAGDATNTASASYSIAIGAAPIRITTASLPAGRPKLAYSATESATGGSGSLTWAVAAGALPGGLALNTATGAITGTPTTVGTYPVTIAATDGKDAANVGSVAYSIVISSGVKITSPRALPTATHGVFYSYQVIASNVVGTAVWNLQGNSLPPGMTLNTTTGVISGTCATKGTWYFNVRVSDVNTNNTLTLGLTVQ
jgi:hypothetical protein